jgi:hypothetical protein
MLLPVFRSAPPTEPWLDLGPIVVRRGRDEAEVTSELIAQAESIGATGFVVESTGEELDRPLNPVVGLVVGLAPRSSSDIGGAALFAAVAGLVALSRRDEPQRAVPRVVTTLRAFRLVREPPPRGPLDGPEVQVLPASVRDALARAPDLGGQLTALEAALLAQTIDLDRFYRAREELCAPAAG